MKIYITTHGDHDDNHVSLCTTDIELAIKHFIDYSKTLWINTMFSIEVWEDNIKILDYGMSNNDIINIRRNIIYDDLKDDLLKQL